VTVRASVIDDSGGLGVLVDGADAALDATVIRGTRADADGYFGSGVLLKRGASAKLSSCLVDANRQDGVSVTGSTASVDATVVRGTALNGDGKFGEGVGLIEDAAAGAPAEVAITRSVIEGNSSAGVLVIGARARIEQSVVRGTSPNAAGDFGRGVAVQSNLETGTRADLTLVGSLVEENHESGVCVLDADAAIEDSVVRATQAGAAGKFGDGVSTVGQLAPATTRLLRTRIEDNARAGLLNVAASIRLGSNVFQCNGFDLEGEDLAGAPFQFEHEGGNVCGCPDAQAECQVLSDGLEPPPALE
jgi:hypothetical protein